MNADNLSVVRNGVAILHVGRCMPAPILKRSYCFVESANRNGRLDFFERVLAMVSTVKATDAGPGYIMADADAAKRCCCCLFLFFVNSLDNIKEHVGLQAGTGNLTMSIIVCSHRVSK